MSNIDAKTILELVPLFDRRLFYTGAGLAIVSAAAFVLTSLPVIPETAPAAEDVTSVEREIPQQGRKIEREPRAEHRYRYMLKEHNGRIAVFPAESDEPELVLDVLVKYLPDFDRTQMQQGIQVKDYEELVRLIEDYTS